jgi:pyruvate formate-lyase activating enzyme-like uncharacterized protein
MTKIGVIIYILHEGCKKRVYGQRNEALFIIGKCHVYCRPRAVPVRVQRGCLRE